LNELLIITGPINKSGSAIAKKRIPLSTIFLSEAIFDEYIAKDNYYLISLILKKYPTKTNGLARDLKIFN